MESDDLEAILATVHALLVAERMLVAAEIVRKFPGRFEQTGYDNWNGGTGIWDVFFEIPPAEYAQLGNMRSEIEEQITAQLKTINEVESRGWYSAKLIPAITFKKEWRNANPSLSRQVRMNIINELRLLEVQWSGDLDEVEFLGRIFDLKQLSSTDSRFKDAAGDIWQHRINNDDWDNDWIYYDSRFNLLGGSENIFLNFLCLIVNPAVRPSKKEALQLVNCFNAHLQPIGWEIYEEERIAGRPRFVFRSLNHNGNQAVLRAKTVADALDSSWMAKAIERLENSIESDPDLAIGTAKDLVEACCKSILLKRGVLVNKTDDLGDLTKKVVRELQLVPEGVTEGAKGADNIRLVLRNLTQLTNNLAQLRGLYGTGHGRDDQYRGLQPRHARLAAASAIAFIDFVAETYRHRELSKRSAVDVTEAT